MLMGDFMRKKIGYVSATHVIKHGGVRASLFKFKQPPLLIKAATSPDQSCLSNLIACSEMIISNEMIPVTVSMER